MKQNSNFKKHESKYNWNINKACVISAEIFITKYFTNNLLETKYKHQNISSIKSFATTLINNGWKPQSGKSR